MPRAKKKPPAPPAEVFALPNDSLAVPESESEVSPLERLRQLFIADAETNLYPYSTLELACQIRARIGSALKMIDRMLIDAARYGYSDAEGEIHKDGFQYGGERIGPKMVGAIYIVNQRSKYMGAKNPALLTEFALEKITAGLQERDPSEMLMFMEGLLDALVQKIPNNHWIKWLDKQGFCEEFTRWLSEWDYKQQKRQEEDPEFKPIPGYTTLYGEPKASIRKKPPGVAAEMVDGFNEASEDEDEESPPDI